MTTINSEEEEEEERKVFQLLLNEHYKVMIKLYCLVEKNLNQKGVEYDGSSFDDILYPDAERSLITSHRGPILAKFVEPCPKLLVVHLLKKASGDGRSSLDGERPVSFDWFHQEPAVHMYVKPISGRANQAGWTDEGIVQIDYDEACFLHPALIVWLPTLREMDSLVISCLMKGLSTPSDYTYLFIKAVLVFRTISVGFSVKDAKLMGPKEMPGYIRGEKMEKVGMLGRKACTIDLDAFYDLERTVLLLSSMEYPSVLCRYGEQMCVYGMPKLSACDIQFVGSEGIVARRKIPEPEQWWKGMISAAAKLGAVPDLIKAFRVTRGWGSWCSGLVKLGISKYDVILDCPPTSGCGSVLMDSKLDRYDRVINPTNLACSIGELICDWACGAEMMTMLFHLCDEFGLANKEMNRNVRGKLDSSIGSSLLREARFFDLGRDNALYREYIDRFDTRIQLIATEDVKSLIITVWNLLLNSLAPGAKEIREQVHGVKCVAFTAYYGSVWSANGTKAIGKEVTINSRSWGGMAKRKSDVVPLRDWLDMYGLSDSILLMSGCNAVQKVGVQEMSQPTFNKIIGASGKYLEVYREVHWLTKYEFSEESEEEYDDDYEAEMDDDKGHILLRSFEMMMSLESNATLWK